MALCGVEHKAADRYHTPALASHRAERGAILCAKDNHFFVLHPMRERPDQPVTLEHLLRARAALAYATILDGAIYAPVFEQLQREIAVMCAANNVMASARGGGLTEYR